MKRGQIKLLETIGVLIVFFVLLAFGITLYGKWQESATDAAIEEAKSIDANNLAIRAASLPELACGTGMAVKEDCYDLEKVKAFQALADKYQEHYFYELGYASIELVQVYPELTAGEGRYVVYNKTAESAEYKVRLIPMSMFDPVSKTYAFAYLRVISFPQ